MFFKSIAIKVGVSFVVLAFMTIATEGVLRIFFGLRQSYVFEMWRYGRNHKLSVDDKRSHVHLPNTASKVMGKLVQIDRWGYRGINREPSQIGRRILVLGDSITFGFGVATDEAYPALLEKNLKQTQVWNAGVGNYNTEQEFATLPFHLARIHPTEVVLGFFINDLEPVQKGPTNPVFQYSILYALVAQAWSSYASGAIHGNFLDNYNHWFETSWEKWTVAATQGVRYLQERNIPLRVLLIPEFHTLHTQQLAPHYARVNEFFKGQNISVCDASHFFPDSATGGSEYWSARDDSHPNALGHKLLEKAIFVCLNRAQ